MDGRRVPTWFLFCNTGRHDLLIGRKWFEKTGALIDCKHRVLVWRTERNYHGRQDVIIPRKELLPPPINEDHQKDADRRDALLDLEPRPTPRRILKRTVAISEL
jgi:hypothetical protein